MKNDLDTKGKGFYEDQNISRNGSKCADYLQNVDKIETICESTLHSSSNNKTGGTKSNLIGGFSLAHIKQHFFDNSKHNVQQPKNKRKR